MAHLGPLVWALSRLPLLMEFLHALEELGHRLLRLVLALRVPPGHCRLAVLGLPLLGHFPRRVPTANRRMGRIQRDVEALVVDRALELVHS